MGDLSYKQESRTGTPLEQHLGIVRGGPCMYLHNYTEQHTLSLNALHTGHKVHSMVPHVGARVRGPAQ